MTDREDHRLKDAGGRQSWWYRTLNMFPFVYLPIVLLIALACAVLLPIVRRIAP